MALPAPRGATAPKSAAAAAPAATAAEAAAKATRMTPATAVAAAVPAVSSPAAKAAEQREDEREHTSAECKTQDPDQEPGQAANHATGRERPADAPEHAAKDRATDDRKNEEEGQQPRQAGDVLCGCAARRRRQRFPVDDAHHPVHGGGDPAVEIAAPELRYDILVDDAVGDRVGQCAFEPVADFDPDLAVLQGDEEQRAVIDALPAELPGLRHAKRVLLDCLRFGRGND